MTLRLPLAALCAGLVVLAGCNRDGAAGSAALDDIANGDAGQILAYNAGHETASQLIAEDSTFSFDRFEAGFRAGLRGDSVEVAYALGLRAGLGLRADTISQIDPEIFLAGFREGLSRADRRVTEAQVAQAQSAFQDSIQVRQLRAQAVTDSGARQRLTEIRSNAQAAQTYLAGIEGQPGVTKTPSGLLFKVEQAGTGAQPTDADRVAIRYVGRLADGTTFDQSPEDGSTVELPVAAVVPGFAEALKGMRVGEQRTVYLPPNLAYGSQGAPGPGGQGGIPPNAALVFDLTLVEILGTEAAPQGFSAP